MHSQTTLLMVLVGTSVLAPDLVLVPRLWGQTTPVLRSADRNVSSVLDETIYR